MKLITLKTKCSGLPYVKGCGAERSITVDADAYRKWEDGALLQEAFPNLDDNDREAIKSGTCPACWDAIFTEGVNV